MDNSGVAVFRVISCVRRFPFAAVAVSPLFLGTPLEFNYTARSAGTISSPKNCLFMAASAAFCFSVRAGRFLGQFSSPFRRGQALLLILTIFIFLPAVPDVSTLARLSEIFTGRAKKAPEK
jgi:hypothetical protein